MKTFWCTRLFSYPLTISVRGVRTVAILGEKPRDWITKPKQNSTQAIHFNKIKNTNTSYRCLVPNREREILWLHYTLELRESIVFLLVAWGRGPLSTSRLPLDARITARLLGGVESEALSRTQHYSLHSDSLRYVSKLSFTRKTRLERRRQLLAPSEGKEGKNIMSHDDLACTVLVLFEMVANG